MASIVQTEFLAGGTDLMERRRSGVSPLTPARLLTDDAMRAITWLADGRAQIGSAVTIDQLARDGRLVAAYPALAAAAAGLATPEIRRMATIGGNLTQRSRCWYYRNHETPCLKKGGSTCPAREGNHLYGVAFDLGPCVAPHPSTLGAALLAYDADVQTTARRLAAADVFGDGRDGTRDHRLGDGEIIKAIVLPVPLVGERGHYARAISRAHAEWPLVEVVMRVAVADNRISTARVALGGVAAVPLRLPRVEAALDGAMLVAVDAHAIAALATEGARPLPQTAYKLTLIRGLVVEGIGKVAAG